MIATITAKQIIEWVIGAFVVGNITGFLTLCLLSARDNKIKKS